MTLRLVQAVIRAENCDELHMGRLLVLLHTAAGRKGTKPINGIMKLAKLDFLLRYPNCLERALKAIHLDPALARVQLHERDTIETQMVRFRYGPWDSRYRRWIGLLVAKGLATTFVKGNTVYVGLTERGHSMAAELGQRDEFLDMEARSATLVKAVGRWSGTQLKEFMYKTFPELLTMKWGEAITI